MPENEPRLGASNDLRERAEERARRDATPADLTPDQAHEVFHELRVHQIELEMQNEALRRSQAELEASRERYFDLYNLAPVGYVTLSEEGVILEANLTASKLFGVERSALVEHPLSHFVLPEDQDIFYIRHKKLFETGTSQMFELRLRKQDGVPLWAHVQATVAEGVSGSPVCRATISDITKRKEAEIRHLASLQELRDLKKAVDEHDVVAISDPQGNLTYVNDRFCALSKYSREELLGQNPSILKSGFHSKEFIRDLWETIRSGRVWKGKFKNRAKDGTFFWLDTTIVPFLDAKGMPYQYMAIRTDITQLKRAEEALQESEAFGVSVRDSLVEHLAVLDKEGTIIAVNRAWRLFAERNGAPELASNPVGINYLAVCEKAVGFPRGEEAEAAREGILSVMNGSQTEFTLEYRCDAPSEPRWFQMHVSPLQGSRKGVVVAHLNITERKRIEGELRASEARFRALVEQAGDGFELLDEDGRFLDVNRSSCQQMGYSREELFNLRVPDIDPCINWAQFRASFPALEKNPVTFETRHKRKDGSEFPVEITTSVIRLGNNRRVLSLVRDITGRKRVEEKLAQRQSFLTAIIENQPGLLWLKDTDGRFLMVNQAFAKACGREKPDAVQGLTDWDLWPKEMAQKYRDDDQRVMQSGKSIKEEEIIFVRDTPFWHETFKTAVCDDNGRVIGTTGYSLDITERKKAEVELRTSAERFKSIFNEAPLGIAVVDSLNGRFYSVNPMFAKIAGRTVEEMKQIDWVSITHPDDIQEDLNKVAAMNAGKISGFQMEKRYRRPDGSYVWINMTIAPLYVEDTTHPRHLLMIEEITERKALQEGLKAAIFSAQRAKEAAEAASRAKDDFIAVLSHELRTPLTPVLATVSDLQEQKEMPIPLRPDIELIRRNVEMEVVLIDDLLDVTRISQGKIVLKQETVDIHHCLGTALEICRAEITGKHLEIRSELQASQHHVFGDSSRLRQVFWNILKNAVKFTSTGGRITLRSWNVGDNVQIAITDTGIGIEPEFMPRIFNLFEQGERSRIRKFGGLGLGLHIARAIVELHGGRLTAFSKGKNKGTTFTVELATVSPLEKAAPHPPAAKPQERSLRILLVEDHPDTLQCLTKLLKKWGHTVTTAENVRIAQELADGEKFDLIVSDLGLPDGSGLDVMRHIKERTGIPGIALSGFGTEEDIRQSRAAGFAEHLVKPVNVAALRTVIQRIAFAGS